MTRPVVTQSPAREAVRDIIREYVYADDATEFNGVLQGIDEATDAILAALQAAPEQWVSNGGDGDHADLVLAPAELDRVRGALSGPAAWLERWASHVGSCKGGDQCMCGLTLAQTEARQALSPDEN